MREYRRDYGFTLLEVLVALMVLGFLMIGLNRGVQTAFDFWNFQSRQLSGRAELDSMVRVLRALLTDLPRNPAAPINAGAPPLAIAFEGTANQLTFVGDLPNGFGDAERADITLTLREQRLVLVWKPHSHEVPSTIPTLTETELFRGFNRVEFGYWGQPAPGSPTEWLSEWAGPAIPELIRIRMSAAKAGARSWPDLIIAPQLATPSG
jgi:general secretion pathway protein J